MNVGSYTQEKAAGYYDFYSDSVGGLICEFVKTIAPVEVEEKPGRRGKIEEEIIETGQNKEE